MKRAVIRGILSLVLALGIGAGISAVPVSSVCAYSSQYNVDRSSVWYDQGNKMFGAGVTDAEGNYFTVAYQIIHAGQSIDNVYESKNSGPWVQIGFLNWHDVQNHYHFGGSASLFIQVANMAAQSKGYDKMF